MKMARTRDLLRSEQGSVGVWIAGGAAAIMGMAAVAVDISNFHLQRTRLQIAADAAVLAAASQIGNGASAALSAAQTYAEKNMPSATYGTVLATEDMEVGEWDSDARTFTPNGSVDNAVRLTLRRAAVNGNQVGSFFGRVLGVDGVDIVVEAMATSTPGQPGCIVALDPGSTSDSLKFSSMGTVDLKPCVPAANSTDSNSIKVSSMDKLRAGSLYSAGGISAPGWAVDLDEPEQEYQPAVTDPYASLPDPAPGGCDYNNFNGSGTLSPGVYCGGLNASGGAIVFNPGTYYIVDGKLDISSTNSVTCSCGAPGSGVTFVITGTTPAQIKTFEFSQINSVSLHAPSDASYDYPGMLLYVDRDAPYDTSTFNSIDNLTFNGALYVPSQRLNINSINYTAQTDCAQTIGYNVTYNSIDAFGRVDNCAAYGTKNISIGAGGGGGPRLVQ